MRRAAKLLKVRFMTIQRKMVFLAEQARQSAATTLNPFVEQQSTFVQFDDLETSEHTKCKPLSVSLIVDQKTRKILGFEVSKIPAKGHLAEIARKKYGYRPDERPAALDRLFQKVKPMIAETAKFMSDQNPLYPAPVRKYFANAEYETVKSRRGCVTGQGELKEGGFDPLFSLNHTCAMLRANMNRLFRRTWCTTKKIAGLVNHLWIYVQYHNETLTQFV